MQRVTGLQENSISPTLTAPVPQVAATGDVQIGGPSGFMASVVASLDTAGPSAALALSHPGGWKPFSSVAFNTPPIEASLEVGGDMFLRMEATATHTSMITLIDGILTLEGVESAPGPELGVLFIQATSHQKLPHTRSSQSSFPAALPASSPPLLPASFPPAS